jgi:D-galactarolactone cycloisomerase
LVFILRPAVQVLTLEVTVKRMSDQRIASFKVYSVSSPVEPPRGVSIRLATAHAYVLVKLVDEAGRAGWGETYHQPGMFEVVRDLAGLLIGHEPWPMREHRDRMAITRTSSEARSALMIALDDLRGHQSGLPVHRLYGGPTRDRVIAYAASQGYLDGTPPEETWPAEVAAFVGAGFQAVKLRIGRFDIRREAALLARVRETTPEHVRLLVDGNGAYSPAGAVRMGRALESHGYGWFEEPLPQTGYPGYPELAAALDIALAGGEAMQTVREAAHLLGRAGLDIIQPEPVICGGIEGALRIAEVAAHHGVPVVPHTSGSAIGIAAALQVIACLSDVSTAPAAEGPMLEMGTDANPWRTRLLVDPYVLDDGSVAIPQGPGLGVSVDEEWLASVANRIG